MNTYAAHITRRHHQGEPTEEVQTVAEHLQHVSSLMGKDAEGMGLSALAHLIGILHDLGKISDEFQRYLRHNVEHPDQKWPRGTVVHSTAGGKFLMERYGSLQEPGVIETIQLAGLVIFSHHSPTGLLDFLSPEGKDTYRRRLSGEDLPEVDLSYFFEAVISPEELDNLFQAAVREVVALADQFGSYGEGIADHMPEVVTFFCGMTEKMMYSLLIDADWLDTAAFAQGEDPTAWECRWETEALWQRLAQRLDTRLAAMGREGHGNPIAQARAQVSEEAYAAAARPQGIYSLSAPTGSGKTYASLRFALHHALRQHQKHIYVILPYTSIIEQNARDIRQVLQEDEAILEYHSDVLAEETLAPADEEGTARALLAERWDVPIIFTTQVQFLQALFAGSAASARRLRSLRDSVIIFDEAQTIPVKCTDLFNLAIDYLAAFQRDTVVLCTATQPSLGALSYPLRFAAQAEILKDRSALFAAFRRTRIEAELPPGGERIEALAAKAVHEAMREGSLLFICNLTKEARLLYQEAQETAAEVGAPLQIYHLSTKMCPAHRRECLARIRKALKGKTPLLVLSTQLIEAGVDISFACVYRVLTGSASIAQAAGRCNRHGEKPYGRVKIVSIEQENLAHLPDLAKGAQVTRDLLALGREADTLLEPEAIEEYFQTFYRRYTEAEKAYALADGITLLDLLSCNAHGLQAYLERGGAEAELPCFLQAFQRAGKEFFVIDRNTVSVLVPYGEGRSYIEAFSAPPQPWEMAEAYRKLRAAQPFMVNLFSWELKKLEEAGALWESPAGIYNMREEYYDESIGVQFENQKNEFCFMG